MKVKNPILRIVLSPFIFIYGILMTLVFSIFPFSLITILGIIFCFICPFIWLYRKTGNNIEYPKGIIHTRYYFINYMLVSTICIWFPFWIVFNFIKRGEI